jgi:hypothetical protein
MNKSFYKYASFFLGLTLVAGFLQSLVYFQSGPNIFTLHSFADWFLVMNLISLAGAVFILAYYRNRQYWVVFSTGTIATLTTVFRSVLAYIQVVPLSSAFQSYYIPALILELSAGIVYAISLIVSGAGKRPWLKLAGVFLLILSLVALSTFIGYLNSPPTQIYGTLQKINQWASVAGSFLPALFIMNFLGELKLLKDENVETPPRELVAGLVDLTRIIALGGLLFLGVNIAGESIRASRPSPKALMLARQFEARTYINEKGDSLQFRLLKPLDYDSTRKYPLVVSLHGGAGYGTDNIRQLDGSWETQTLMEPVNRKKYPAFILVPQCTRGSSWGGLPKLKNGGFTGF